MVLYGLTIVSKGSTGMVFVEVLWWLSNVYVSCLIIAFFVF